MANEKPESGKQATNPKQLLIVAVLLVVMITVGVVQFGGLLGGDAPPAQTPAGQSGGDAQAQGTQAEPANTDRLTLPPLPPHDPFRPVIVAAKPQEEPNRVVRSEPTSRPQREITGTPPLSPMTLPPGTIGLQPAEGSTPQQAPEQLHYTITGVVQGPNSVAILADKEGRRRFVKQGDPLEEGWRVVRIQRGAVVLQKGKQRITVRVGESTTPNGGNTP
ncbi:MAG: hypothetical protein ACUVV1_02850 [Fimbriimonadales bacterium]